MAIRIALHHETVYRFDREVSLAPHMIRLRPAPHCRTAITGYSLTVEPAGHFLNWQQKRAASPQRRAACTRSQAESRQLPRPSASVSSGACTPGSRRIT